MSMLSSIVFSCTDQCPIQCKYCGAECGPDQKDRLSLDDMISVIDKLYEYGKLHMVVFTGGEPTLLGNDLIAAIQYCSQKNLWTRIVTNAFWAHTAEKAKTILQSFKDAGLSEINLSCDDYHQEFIPLDRIKYANDACTELGIPCLIGHKIMKDHKLSVEYLENYLGHPLTLFDPGSDNPKNNIISSGYTVPVEKNMHQIPDEDILYPKAEHLWKGPCKSLLQRVIITPRKELSICCGMIRRNVEEIVFKSLDHCSLEELIVTAHQDLIVNWLALEGPYGIMKFILKKDPDIVFRKQYVNICHLCSEIFTREDCRNVLLSHAAEKVTEIYLERSLYDYIRTENFFKTLSNQ
ncbi:MAG: radical SAM protein [Pseudomonadota bacterium]